MSPAASSICPAHLARQPADPLSAGRPPPRPLHAAQLAGAADPAERHQCRLPRHRSVQITWLANRQILYLPEDRRHGRFTPRNSLARLILPNGTNVACRVIDLSASGAAVAIAPDLRPAVGSAVTIGKTPGRAGRHIEDGFSIYFTRLQHPDFIEDNVTGE